MAVRPLLFYGDPRLVAPNQPVDRFGRELEPLLRDLLDTCRAAPGLGLAAPQIGANLRLAIVDLSAGVDPEEVLVLANPELVDSSGSRVVEEGCLSFPGLYARFQRPSRVVVRAQDAWGRSNEVSAEELQAQALCHELDHLNGALLPDRLRGHRRRVFLARVAWSRRRWKQPVSR